MKLEIGEEARQEVEAAAERYESKRPGLGDEFIVAVLDATDAICAHPPAWAIWPDMPQGTIPVQRFVMERFPFSVGFQVHGDTVRVVTVAHASRLPGYWSGRDRL